MAASPVAQPRLPEPLQAPKLESFCPIPLSIARHAKLSPFDKLVYASMLSFQGRLTACAASHANIGKRINVSTSQVKRSIAKLLEYNTIRHAQPHEIPDQPPGKPERGKLSAYVCLFAQKAPKKTSSRQSYFLTSRPRKK